MPRFGDRSLYELQSCDHRLQDIMHEAIKYVDFSILWGHRGEDDQNRLYAEGRSNLTWPNSKHNLTPALAIDIAPYNKQKPHFRWGDIHEFIYLAGLIKGIAFSHDVEVRWGGDWDMDYELRDNRFNDYGHFELMKE